MTDRCLLSLPTRLGGLCAIDPSKYSAYQLSSSVHIVAPLILQQSTTYIANVSASQPATKKLVVDKHELLTHFNTLLPQLCPRLQRAVSLSLENLGLLLAHNSSII